MLLQLFENVNQASLYKRTYFIYVPKFKVALRYEHTLRTSHQKHLHFSDRISTCHFRPIYVWLCLALNWGKVHSDLQAKKSQNYIQLADKMFFFETVLVSHSKSMIMDQNLKESPMRDLIVWIISIFHNIFVTK